MRNAISLFIIFFHKISKSQKWEEIGSGGGDFNTLLLYADTTENRLYTAGNFSTWSSVNSYITARGVARWNGLKWESLGKGICAVCYDEWPWGPSAIIKYKGDIYVGGLLDGYTGRGDLIKWDGLTWSTVVEENFGRIKNFYIYHDTLYCVGSFKKIEGITAGGIATWDGRNWNNIKNASTSQIVDLSTISDIIHYNGNLYIGGDFDVTSGSLYKLAYWNDGYWESVFSKTDFVGDFAEIFSLEVFKGELYIAGNFYGTYQNKVLNGIARWNGNELKDVGGGLGNNKNFEIYNLIVYKDALYAVGGFMSIGGIPAGGIAQWDGEKWCSLSNIDASFMPNMTIYRDTLIVSNGTSIFKWSGGDNVDTCSAPLTIENAVSGINHEAIIISPNPASPNISIKFNLKSPPDPEYSGLGVSVTLYTLTGQEAYRKDFGKISGTTEKTIDLSSLAQGMYLCRVQAGGEVVYRKVVRY